MRFDVSRGYAIVTFASANITLPVRPVSFRRDPMTTFDIGVDLDGVGYNLQAALAPFARAQGYRAASEESWNRIDPETGLHGGFFAWGITDYDEFLALCSKASTEGALYASGAPFPGFASMMRTLDQEGHRLHIITARTKDPQGAIACSTRRWLKDWAIPHQSLSFSSDKASRKTDLFIEDSAFNYERLLDGGMTVPFLVSRPWNVNIDVEHRVDDLDEFTHEVRKRADSTASGLAHNQGLSDGIRTR